MEQSPNIKEGVLRAINDHKVKMRPALLFKAEFILIALVSLLLLVVMIGLAGFVLFALRVNGHEALLGFGVSGIGTFLRIFPWPLFILGLVLIFILQALIRRFAFGYRKPIFLILVTLFVGGGVSALALDRGTPLHDRLREGPEHGGLPFPFGGLYGNARGPAPHEQGIFRGVVSAVQTDRITIKHDDLDADQDEKGFDVILPDGQAPSSFSVGENVYIYGTEDRGVITAIGITKLPSLK